MIFSRPIVVSAVLSCIFTSVLWSAFVDLAIAERLVESRRQGYLDGMLTEAEEHRISVMWLSEENMTLRREVDRLSGLYLIAQ